MKAPPASAAGSDSPLRLTTDPTSRKTPLKKVKLLGETVEDAKPVKAPASEASAALSVKIEMRAQLLVIPMASAARGCACAISNASPCADLRKCASARLTATSTASAM